MLRAAWRRSPGDFWVNFELGMASWDPRRGELERPEEAVRYLTAAIAARPHSHAAHVNLGTALAALGRFDEAESACRQAILLQPDNATAHYNLGVALAERGRSDEAASAYREAVRLRPAYARAHYNLGVALAALGRADEAIVAYREAIRLDPDDAEAHNNLGAILNGLGRAEEAAGEFRETIRLNPGYAEAHCNLGLALRQMRRYSESASALRRGHELGSRRPDWDHPSAQWLAESDRLASLSDRLPGILRGDDTPKDTSERLALAQLCYDTQRFAASARLWSDALSSDPRLADDREAQHRYNAACSAALAGCGLGADDPPPDASAQAALRRLALDWLESERAAWAHLLESAPAPARDVVSQKLGHWRQDPDLSGVRDAAALSKLPEAEREAWRALWADVDTLLKKAQGL